MIHKSSYHGANLPLTHNVLFSILHSQWRELLSKNNTNFPAGMEQLIKDINLVVMEGKRVGPPTSGRHGRQPIFYLRQSVRGSDCKSHREPNTGFELYIRGSMENACG